MSLLFRKSVSEEVASDEEAAGLQVVNWSSVVNETRKEPARHENKKMKKNSIHRFRCPSVSKRILLFLLLSFSSSFFFFRFPSFVSRSRRDEQRPSIVVLIVRDGIADRCCCC